MLKSLADKTGLSTAEIKIFFFLLILLCAGLLYKQFRVHKNPREIVFNYKVQDSLFAAANDTNKISRSSSLQNNKFDYEQEVLDFNERKFEQVKKTSVEKSIDLNKAGLNELMSVPGLGEKTALKILEYRNTNGSFRDIKQLLDIKGIGNKKFEKIRSYVYVE